MSEGTGIGRGGLRRWWRRHERHVWCGARRGLLGILGVATVGLGCAGFAQYMAPRGQPYTDWDLLYLTLQLFVLQSGAVPPPLPWTLEVARLLAPAVSAYAAASALAALFYRQAEWLRLSRLRGHVVICGLGRKGLRLARGFAQQGAQVVAIECREGSPLIEEARQAGVSVLVGDARSPEMLRRAGIRQARCLISVCGNDGNNAEVAVRACEAVAGRHDGVLTCFVHIVDPQLCSLLGQREAAMEKSGPFRLEFFNVFDSGARALLAEFPPFAAAEAPGGPHLLVVGVGRMGESVVENAVRAWRAAPGQGSERLRITIVDVFAQRRVEMLRLRDPHLEEACDLAVCPLDVRWPEFQQASFLFDDEGRCTVTVVYICLDSDSLGLSTGLALLQRLQGQAVPIVVRTTDDSGLASLLSGAEGIGGFDSVRAFGLLEHTCRPEMLLSGPQPRACDGR